MRDFLLDWREGGLRFALPNHLPVRRSTTFDTVGIFQATKLAAGPLRVVLLRTFTPEGDPYEQMLSPQTDPRPYYDGSVRYSAVLFVGARLRLQVEIGKRP